MKSLKPLVLKLSSCGNPDFNQSAPLSPYKEVPIFTLKSAVAVCKKYIAFWNLGGGNWTGGQILEEKNGKQIAQVSYNGKLWDMDDKEIK